MNAETFGKFAAVSFQQQIAYRFDYFMAVINGFLYIFIFTSLWRAVYGAHGEGHGGYTLAGITAYAVVAMAIRISFSMDDTVIYNKVRDGSIAMDLLRPVPFFGMHLAECAGYSAFHLVARGLPILLVSWLMFGGGLRGDVPSLLLGGASLLMGYLIIFMLNFIWGLLAFWFIEIFPFQLLKYALINLFGGSVIPMEFFPEVMRPFISLMPFQHVFYTPAVILTGHAAGQKAAALLAEQAIWTLLMAGACIVAWRRGRDRLVIQGG